MKKILMIILLLLIVSTSVFATSNINNQNGINHQFNYWNDYITLSDESFISIESINKFLNGKADVSISLKENKIVLNKNSSKIFSDIKKYTPNNKIEISYSDKLEIPVASEIYNADYIVITNSSGKEITDIDYKRVNNVLLIEKTYYLELGETYIVKAFNNNQMFKQEVFIKPYLTKYSFKSPHPDDTFKSVIVPPQPSKGFYFPYRLAYSTMSKDEEGYSHKTFEETKDILYIEGTNHGVDYSYENMILNADSMYGASMASWILADTSHNGFSMISYFPRLRDEGGIYTHALDRQTMFGTKEWWKKFDRGNLYRIDKQFVAMQKDARMQLANMGRNVGQPILAGFSASSDFASRINYLYPDLAKAVIINDPPTVPLEEYNGVELKYPLGMADLEEITGNKFNKEKFLDTPQFWTTGSRDDNDGTYFTDGWGSYTLDAPDYRSDINFNQEGVDYRKAFGDEITSRKENIRRILKEKGFNNIEMHTYDVGHEKSDEIMKDIEIFLNKIIK